ncbi:MAG: zinc ribbon domain-containing protein [Anaerolineae bacterium]|nr:zinc ribbon domain-containing protein [Anaerolineae bacterium]
MPRYDYQCSDCQTTFEVQLKFSEIDAAQPTCPRCGSTNARRQFRPGSVLIKSTNSGYRLSSDDMHSAVGMAESTQIPGASGHDHDHSQHHHDHDHHDHHHD